MICTETRPGLSVEKRQKGTKQRQTSGAGVGERHNIQPRMAQVTKRTISK